MKKHTRHPLLPFIAILLFGMVGCEKEEPIEPATLSTISVTNISVDSGQSGGNITSDGGGDITSRGVVWSTSSSPSVEQNTGITMDGSGTGLYQSAITGLESNTTYYVRAYATNEAGMVYGNEQEFTTKGGIPTVTTVPASNITQISATSGGNVTDDGGSDITARGVVWSTSENPELDNKEGIDSDSEGGTGEFTSSLTDLNANTKYYVRAYATNGEGTGYGNQESFTTDDDNGNSDGPTEVVDVTNPETGKTWMDRNLGASRSATSSTDEEAYGDLYQWGRAADGHQIRTSGTTSTLSTSDNPGHVKFILAPNSPWDWRNPQNHNLWQGVNGINNPCPAGYRLPTAAELNAERQSWSSNGAAGAFASPLKLPVAGSRLSISGLLNGVGFGGGYWSATVDGSGSRGLAFVSTNTDMINFVRTYGNSVRCIKD